MLKYFPLGLLLSFTVRLLVFGAGIGEAIAALGFLALYGVQLYLSHLKELETLKVDSEVKKHNESVLSEIETFRKEVVEVKSALNGVKVVSNIKPSQIKF